MFRRLLFSGVGVLTAIIALLGMKGVFSRILEVEGWTYLGFTMLFVMLVSAVIYLIYRVKNIEKYYKVIVISLFGFLTLSLVVASLSVYSTNHSWDVSVVKMLAENYIAHGTTEVARDMWEYNYLARYDNNIPITLLLVGILKAASIFGISGNVAILGLNSLSMLLSCAMIIYAIYKSLGARASLAAFIPAYVFVAISPFLTIFYTDTLGLFAISLIVLLLVKFKSTNMNRFLYSGLIGSVAGFSLLVKPTTLIVFIAIAIVFVAKNIKNLFKWNFLWPNLLMLGSFFSGLLILTLTYSLIFNSMPNFAKYSDGLIDQKRVSAIHYLGMGSLRGLAPFQKCETGGYCPELVDWITGEEGIKSLDEKNNFSFNLWHKSVETDFPWGYLGFAGRKIESTFSDGSFGAWGEGASNNDKIIFLSRNPVAKKGREFLGINPKRGLIVRGLWQGVWLLVLLSIFSFSLLLVAAQFKEFKLLKKYRDSNRLGEIFIVAIFGLALYQILFESRARYIYLFIPIFAFMFVLFVDIFAKWFKHRYHQASKYDNI